MIGSGSPVLSSTGGFAGTSTRGCVSASFVAIVVAASFITKGLENDDDTAAGVACSLLGAIASSVVSIRTVFCDTGGAGAAEADFW